MGNRLQLDLLGLDWIFEVTKIEWEVLDVVNVGQTYFQVSEPEIIEIGQTNWWVTDFSWIY